MDDDESNLSKITVTNDGPLRVSGDVTMQRYTKVESVSGEPVIWRAGESERIEGTTLLCRCGASGNKPYCDNSHRDIAFDGTETAPTDDYVDRAKELGGRTITVFDDRSICEHAGFCGNQVTNVWKLTKNEDTLDGADEGLMTAMIEHCPSGALTYAVGGDFVEVSHPQEIRVVDDGPLWVTGGVPVERSDGEPFESRNRMTLCRCGASSNKPLCDGSHNEIGWSG